MSQQKSSKHLFVSHCLLSFEKRTVNEAEKVPRPHGTSIPFGEATRKQKIQTNVPHNVMMIDELSYGKNNFLNKNVHLKVIIF